MKGRHLLLLGRGRGRRGGPHVCDTFLRLLLPSELVTWSRVYVPTGDAGNWQLLCERPSLKFCRGGDEEEEDVVVAGEISCGDNGWSQFPEGVF